MYHYYPVPYYYNPFVKAAAEQSWLGQTWGAVSPYMAPAGIGAGVGALGGLGYGLATGKDWKKSLKAALIGAITGAVGAPLLYAGYRYFTQPGAKPATPPPPPPNIGVQAVPGMAPVSIPVTSLGTFEQFIRGRSPEAVDIAFREYLPAIRRYGLERFAQDVLMKPDLDFTRSEAAQLAMDLYSAFPNMFKR